jgi:hypothetical protein
MFEINITKQKQARNLMVHLINKHLEIKITTTMQEDNIVEILSCCVYFDRPNAFIAQLHRFT